MIELKGTGAKCGRKLTIALALTLGMLTLVVRLGLAKEATAKETKTTKEAKTAKKAEKPRIIPVTINKGDTYTISGLKKGSAADSKAVKNPNSLSVQHQPSGDIVLLGTEAGSWNVDVTLANGEKVIYEVTVRAAAPPINSLTPGSAASSTAP